MAQQHLSPTVPPTAPPDASGSSAVAADFEKGQNLLVADVFWRWATAHMLRAEKRGLTQAAVAVECNLDESGFAKFLNRQRTITLGAWVKMQRGFSHLARQKKFEFTPLEMPDDRSFGVAGWLHALNRQGARQGVSQARHPLGVLHYYCLRVMFANEAWYKATAGGLTPAQLSSLAVQVFELAQEEAGRVSAMLEDYAQAEKLYPIASTHASLRELCGVWTGPWRVVYTWMGDGP